MYELLEEKREDILRIAAEYGAHNVRIFGSVARHEARPDRDFDFLVDFEPAVSLLDHAGLWLALEALLGCKVDISTASSLKAYLRETVLREAIPL